MPRSGLPFGSSGSPWVNAANAADHSLTIGAVGTGNGGSVGSAPVVLGTVFSADTRSLLSLAGSQLKPIRQSYGCSGATTQTATVSAVARQTETTEQIRLSALTFTVSNPTNAAVTVSQARVSIPDPDRARAPYVNGSAAIAAAPGWHAGHDSGGLFATSGAVTLAPGETISTPAVSALYSDAGPVGTPIAWHPGAASLTLTSPSASVATCSPTAPLATLARIVG